MTSKERSKGLSGAAVARFKATKILEAKKTDSDRLAKANALMDARKHDKKAMRTVKSMLHMTKSASKAAIRTEDVSTKNGAGRNQCDEDDYGYESVVAGGIYERLMAKFDRSSDGGPAFAPAKPRKAKNLDRTVARVKEALKNPNYEAEEKARRAKKAAAAATSSAKREVSPDIVEEPASKKSRRQHQEEEARRKRLAQRATTQRPPAQSFEDLMKMAQKKHKEPVKPVESNPINPEAEFGRPMTKKDKEEYLREQKSILRKKGKASAADTTEQQSTVTDEKNHNSSKTSVVVSAEAEKKKKKPPVITGPEFHPAVLKSKEREKSRQPKPSTTKHRSVQNEHKTAAAAAAAAPAANEWKRPRADRSPPSVQSVRRGRNEGSRMRIDSESEDEEEEDDEMGDFIDDSSANVDISSEIQKIFGYDRRKFRDEPDFDDRSMENNRFGAIMKEEARSAKIGLQEDQEDMRREEEENKRKRKKKKR